MKNRFTIILSGLVLLSHLSGCGGSGNTSGTTATTSPSSVSSIPNTQAVAAVGAPPASNETSEPAVVNQAVLRHVHRNTVAGILKPDSDFTDSPNGKVERLSGIGLYIDVERQADNTYLIDPKSNGLSYFRVTNTKPNGSVRVHNFHGVPAGHYMTFDSTDIEDIDNDDNLCRKVAIRLTNLPQQVASTARLLVNGRTTTNVIYEQTKGYVQEVDLCPINQNQHYLAVVVFEGQPGNIEYGFNFYESLQDNDLLEIDVTHLAENLAWSTDYPIGEILSLHGMNPHWSVQVGLYTGSSEQSQSGFYPHFAQLTLQTYRLDSEIIDFSSGIKVFNREFTAGMSPIHFANNNMVLNNVNLNPLQLSWQSDGIDKPKVVSGVIFDTDLTQTYAFMSMDPQVLADNQFDFPIDDIELVADSSLVGLTGAAGISENGKQFIGNAALTSGFLYWPSNPEPNNSDLYLTADVTQLLQLLMDLNIKNNP
jgi:hypothetical protein